MPDRRVTVVQSPKATNEDFSNTVLRPLVNHIDISRLIAMLDYAGVTVTCTELLLLQEELRVDRGFHAGTITGGPYFNAPHTYLVKYLETSIVIKYFKSQGGSRRIDSINVTNPLEPKGLLLSADNVSPQQGSELLAKCDKVQLMVIAAFRQEQQAKFDAMMDTIAAYR